MGVPSHEKNVEDWKSAVLGGRAWRVSERNRRRMVDDGDVLYSYGMHFPLVRLIRTRGGKPSHWLINGDTWGGGGWSMTGAHQSAVRDVIGRSTLPHVIVPQSVLDAAGIDSSSVQIVESTEPWFEPREDVYAELPHHVRWRALTERLPGTGVWVNERTGETREGGAWGHAGRVPGEPDWMEYMRGIPYDEDGRRAEANARYQRDRRRNEAQWTWCPPVEKSTGRMRLVDTRWGWLNEWDAEDRDGTVVYVRRWTRHWLGQSVIRGRITYSRDTRCPDCRGTGEVAPYPFVRDVAAEGPLNEREDERWLRWHAHGFFEPRTVRATDVGTACQECRGSGRRTVSGQRWAYFLSGFDENEPRPSYFFCELPPGRITSVADAYRALKPQTVRLAEEMGRTVLRQGDQWFIEMPGLTTRDLAKQGAVRHRRGDEGREKQLWESDNPQPWQRPPRFQRFVNENCWLHGTTHEATEVAVVGRLTYARGIVRHVPEGRAPDHIPLHLGDRKTWFLAVPNGTPQAR